jgi:hypothetical protein
VSMTRLWNTDSLVGQSDFRVGRGSNVTSTMTILGQLSSTRLNHPFRSDLEVDELSGQLI